MLKFCIYLQPSHRSRLSSWWARRIKRKTFRVCWIRIDLWFSEKRTSQRVLTLRIPIFSDGRGALKLRHSSVASPQSFLMVAWVGDENSLSALGLLPSRKARLRLGRPMNSNNQQTFFSLSFGRNFSFHLFSNAKKPRRICFFSVLIYRN